MKETYSQSTTHPYKKSITIVTPVYNEEESIPHFYKAINRLVNEIPYDMRLLFVSDGSTDKTNFLLSRLAARDNRVGYIEFSRNFGKEAATTAGIHAAHSDAVILIDADMQHPVELIPQFVKKWEEGADIVVGVRDEPASDSAVKRMGSNMYHKLMRSISDTPVLPNATDFRLLDRRVIDEFKRFTEHERMTRGLIDWLGYNREVIPFKANERVAGSARYSVSKLWNLAVSSIVGNSLLPLRFAGYLGALISPLSLLLGIVMFIDRFVYSFNLHFSGSAMLADLIVFLVGIILICIGLLAYYIGQIFQETQNRPIYIIRRKLNTG